MSPDLNNGEENPYDFIFKQDAANTPVGSPVVVNRKKQIILFALFVSVVLILTLVVFSIISSSSRDKGTEAITARSYQAEITRVYELGIKNVRDVELREKFVTLHLVITADQQKLDTLIAAKGVEPTSLQLSAAKNSARDKELTDSLQTDKHDEVFSEMIDDLSGQYYAAARAAEAAAKNNRERETLSSIRKNIELLYQEVVQTQNPNPTPAAPPAAAPEAVDQ